MSDQLKPGDRVRVTDRNQVQGYEAGDKGIVQAVASIPAIGDQLHYQVAMDRDGGVSRAVFTAEEIELDVGLYHHRRMWHGGGHRLRHSDYQYQRRALR